MNIKNKKSQAEGSTTLKTIILYILQAIFFAVLLFGVFFLLKKLIGK